MGRNPQLFRRCTAFFLGTLECLAASALAQDFSAPVSSSRYFNTPPAAAAPAVDGALAERRPMPLPPLVPSGPLSSLDEVQPAAFQYGSAGPYGGQPTRLSSDCQCGGQCGDEPVCQYGCTCDACYAKCPLHTFIGLVGYEMFRGYPDGGWGNWGIHSGFNYGTRLGRFSEWTGVGFQIGGTVGVYDWSGTDYRLQNQDQAETQGFITFGLFRNPTEQSHWNGAVVQDWMINDTFGVFGEDPTLHQWRVQLGYVVNDYYEYGVWGAWRGHGASRDVPGFGRTTWRPVNQLNFYVRRSWPATNAETWLWFGVPDRDRLEDGGSLGDYLVGARAECPLSDRWRVYSLVTYMHPSASPGPEASLDEAWSWIVGLAFYPGQGAMCNSYRGRRWAPRLPVASNGYFLVDTSQVY